MPRHALQTLWIPRTWHHSWYEQKTNLWTYDDSDSRRNWSRSWLRFLDIGSSSRRTFTQHKVVYYVLQFVANFHQITHVRFENAVLSTSGVSETNRKQKSEFRAVRISILAVSCWSPFFQWICTKFRSEKKSNDADFVLGGQRNRILDMAPNRPEFNSFASLFQKVKYYKTSGLS